MSTPITDRYIWNDAAHDRGYVPIETARSLEQIAGELAEAIYRGAGYTKEQTELFAPVLARWQAMKDEATK